jgi:electron-transferring-flavoprotein dehydrogenase
MEDGSVPPIAAESDGMQSGFAADVSFEPVSVETVEEAPGVLIAAEAEEAPPVPAADLSPVTRSVPVMDEAPEVPIAAAEKPAVAPPAPPAPSSDVSSPGTTHASSGIRSGRRREAFAKEDRVAAVNGILDAVRAAAAEAERAAVTAGSAVEGVTGATETDTRKIRAETGPETRAGLTDGQNAGVKAPAGEADGSAVHAASREQSLSGSEILSREERPSEIGADAANDVADTDALEMKTELKDEPMPEVTVGLVDDAGIRVEDGIRVNKEEAVGSGSAADVLAETAPAAVPELKRERFQTDVLIAGAGVAGISTAIRLLQRVNAHNAAVEEGRLSAGRLEMPQVMVVEKAADIGNHVVSGAAVDPVSLKTLFPDFEKRGAPIDAWVENNPFYYLSSKAAIRVPITPPGMGSKGCFITSLSRLTRWLASEAESLGAQTAAGFAAVDWLEAGGAVAGLRLGDKGIDKQGLPRHNAMAGDEIEARVTVLAEGVHGTLTRRAIHAFGLDRDAMPQAAVLAIKEIIELPEERSATGTALHTFGYPHDASTYAGGFLYAGPGRTVTIGLATGLDYRDPLLDPHDLFVRWKSHPLLQKWIGGGKVIEYGAKTIPEGGYFSVPRLVADGLMIVGDAGGLLNSIRLKGIHLAVQSGIDAGDALFEAWKSGNFGKTALEAYPKAFFGGWAGREMRRVRNLHQCYHGGQMAFMAGIGLHTATLGFLPAGRLPIRPDADSLTPLSKRRSGTKPFAFTPDGLMPDKLSDVFLSGTVHEEDQPSHIAVLDGRVCAEKCKPEFDCPCTRFCPAQVYEWSEEEKKIRVNFTNCLHCQTCETKDPFRNISWKLPEGGGGPKYKGM